MSIQVFALLYLAVMFGLLAATSVFWTEGKWLAGWTCLLIAFSMIAR